MTKDETKLYKAIQDLWSALAAYCTKKAFKSCGDCKFKEICDSIYDQIKDR